MSQKNMFSTPNRYNPILSDRDENLLRVVRKNIREYKLGVNCDQLLDVI